jgi:hypothetical protein
MKRNIFAITLITSLIGGCAVTEEEVKELVRLNDRQICMEYMTLPSLNRLQDAREQIIRKKGIDCWRYGNVTAMKNRADAEFSKSIRDIAPPPPPPTPSTTRTTNCVRVDDGMRCTTN